jgi:Ubiquitin-like domain
MLGFYGVESGMEIHVVDADPFSMSRGGGLEDVSLVKKYRMSEEDYDNVCNLTIHILYICHLPMMLRQLLRKRRCNMLSQLAKR